MLPGYIVTPSSASLGIQGDEEVRYILNRQHRNLCKLWRRDEDWKQMARVLGDAGNAARKWPIYSLMFEEQKAMFQAMKALLDGEYGRNLEYYMGANECQ